MPQDIDLRAEYEQGWKVTDIFVTNNIGLTSGQDAKTVAYTFDEARKLASLFSLPEDVIEAILYRPFDRRFIVYSKLVITRPRTEVMQHMLAGRNVALVTTRSVEIGRGWEHIFCASDLIQLHTVSLKEVNCFFPLYLYSNLGPNNRELFFTEVDISTTAPGGRRPNLSPAFIADMSARLDMQFVADGGGDLQTTFGPEDVFDYLYAVFHSPAYRARYAEFLKIDFPRLPLTTDADLFRALCGFGQRLVALHVMEAFGAALPSFPERGNNVVEKIEYRVTPDEPERGRVCINAAQYFDGVPPRVWEFHVGGYQVCHKWLKDRKGRTLSYEDINHYRRVAAALAETITLMEQIDAAIEEHGGWPLR